jgi:hypothetical protein
MFGIPQFLKRAWRNIRASGTARPSKWLVDWVRGDESDSGIEMTTEKALAYAPVSGRTTETRKRPVPITCFVSPGDGPIRICRPVNFVRR